MKPYLLAFCILALFACRQKPAGAGNNLPPLKLGGLSYSVAPQLDSATCSVTGACDCCASDYIFLTDSTFAAVDYCVGDYTYYRGTYRTTADSVWLHVDSLRLFKQYNMEADDSAYTGPEYIVKLNFYEEVDLTWQAIRLKNCVCFKGKSEYAAPAETNLQQFIGTARADSIWQMLMEY